MADAIILHKNAKDLSGRRFGRLIVVALDESSRSNGLKWECQCDCGAQKSIKATKLMRGVTRSCGCIRDELRTKHGHNRVDHKTPEYRVWDAMIQRCENSRNKAFANYGGRGIRVCAQWLGFAAFLSDMGLRPTPLHCIERVDNNVGYQPDNCKWATRHDQQRNLRSNVYLTYEGETLCSVDWDRRFGWPDGITASRVRLGWTVDRIMTTPHRPRNMGPHQ